MIRMFKSVAVVGIICAVSSASAFAEPLNLNPLGINLNTPVLDFNAVDLDPLHLFTPAPAPAAPMKVKHHIRHKHHMVKK